MSIADWIKRLAQQEAKVPPVVKKTSSIPTINLSKSAASGKKLVDFLVDHFSDEEIGEDFQTWSDFFDEAITNISRDEVLAPIVEVYMEDSNFADSVNEQAWKRLKAKKKVGSEPNAEEGIERDHNSVSQRLFGRNFNQLNDEETQSVLNEMDSMSSEKTSAQESDVKEGDEIIISETAKVHPDLKGKRAIVDEVKSWGVQAGVPHPDDPGQVAYVRVSNGEFKKAEPEAVPQTDKDITGAKK